MDIRVHAVVGGLVGGIISVGVGNDPVSLETGIVTGIGMLSGIAPDLDTHGKSNGQIMFSYRYYHLMFILISIMLAGYSYLMVEGNNQYLGYGIAAGIFIVTRFVTVKHMLTVAGIGLMVAGILFAKVWLILVGVYLIISSFVGYRTYTHTIWGLIYIVILAITLNYDILIKGIYPTVVIAYVLHLVMDIKYFNDGKGIQIFRPFSKYEL